MHPGPVEDDRLAGHNRVLVVHRGEVRVEGQQLAYAVSGSGEHAGAQSVDANGHGVREDHLARFGALAHHHADVIAFGLPWDLEVDLGRGDKEQWDRNAIDSHAGTGQFARQGNLPGHCHLRSKISPEQDGNVAGSDFQAARPAEVDA